MSEQKHNKITFVVIVVFSFASIIMGAIVIIGSDLSVPENVHNFGIGLFLLGIAMVLSGILQKQTKKAMRGINIGLGVITFLGAFGMFSIQPDFTTLIHMVIILTMVFGVMSIIKEAIGRKKHPISIVHFALGVLMIGISTTMIAFPQTDTFLAAFYIGFVLILMGATGVLSGTQSLDHD